MKCLSCLLILSIGVLIEIEATENDNDTLNDNKLLQVIRPQTNLTQSSSKKENVILYKVYAEAVSNNLDDITFMSVDAFKPRYSIRQVKYDANQGRLIAKYGSQKCSLESDPSDEEAENDQQAPRTMPICPWHYELTLRDNIYPYMRINAKCNCVDCLAKTKFDAKYTMSYCRQVFTLMPVLIKTRTQSADFEWKFAMEQVATSCVCSINLKSFK